MSDLRICDLVQQADAYFQSLAEGRSRYAGVSTAEIRTQHERFDDWAKHVGAVNSGRGGLDYVLRDSTSLSTTIKELLQDLIADLSDYQEEHGRLSVHLDSASYASDQLITVDTSSPQHVLVDRTKTSSSGSSNLLEGIQDSIGLLSRLNATLLEHEPHDYLERSFIAEVGTVIGESLSSTSSLAGSDAEDDDPNTDARYACRLCNTHIALGDYNNFRKHLLLDLEPYTCLYHDCPSPDRLYSSQKAWTEHVKFVHGKVWRCCFGCTQTLGTREGFDTHLRESHRGRFVEAEIPSLADLCEKHVLVDDDARCPLCKDVTSPGDERQQHIGAHMEELTLCALEPVESSKADKDHNYGYPTFEATDRFSITDSTYGRSRTAGTSVGISTAPTSILDPEDDTAFRQQIPSPKRKSSSLAGVKDQDTKTRRRLEGQDARDIERTVSGKSTGRSSAYSIASDSIGKSSDSRIPMRTRQEGRSQGRTPPQSSLPYTSGVPEIQASCAICGAPPYPECPHEAERLELALTQAAQRWAGMQAVREWVLDHARDQVISTFNLLKSSRRDAHAAYLQTLPGYTLYHKWQGQPPLQAAQLYHLHQQIQQANATYKIGIDEDWRRSCMKYPEVLDYYFGLVDISYPDEEEPAIREPRFGQPLKGTKKQKARRRRNSRDRTPPPRAPMPAAFR